MFEVVDVDDYDDRCIYVLICEMVFGLLIVCFCMLMLLGGYEIGDSYLVCYYNLFCLCEFDGKMVEIGCFCIYFEWYDFDILWLVWGVLVCYVDDEVVQMLFGCFSFMGIDIEGYVDIFVMLCECYLVLKCWLLCVKVFKVFCFVCVLWLCKFDLCVVMVGMLLLLWFYLVMGGWVSDYVVVDNQLNILYVFIGLEICVIFLVWVKLFCVVGVQVGFF